MRIRNCAIAGAILTLSLIAVLAQDFERRRAREGSGGRRWRPAWDPREGVPEWQAPKHLEHDVFTFTRVKYQDSYDDWWGRGKWATDYPASDLNFSYRLEQLTSMKVHPDGEVRELTAPDLGDFPFLYLIEPGRMRLVEP